MQEEPLNLRTGNLYSPFPIPAYQVLARAKEYNAQRVLICLVSHMGYNNRCVWPSYETIMNESGVRNRSTVSRALSTLVEFGFIKTFHIREGKRERSKYYLQGSCWSSSLMNEKARSHRLATAQCLACLQYLDRGDYFLIEDGLVHYKCGGFGIRVPARPLPNFQTSWWDKISQRNNESAEDQI